MITKEELRDLILEGKDISNIDYSHITNMSCMFNNCSSLKAIPELDTSNVTDVYCMFYGCSNLEYLEDSLAFLGADFSNCHRIQSNYPELII